MSRAFVIPDIHLKPWMIDKAEERLSKVDYDIIVCLGDLVDDWNQQNNRKLYHETFDAIVAFAKRHQNMFFCYGNHDVSYLWEALETGYSPLAREIVLEGLDALKAALPPENVAYLHRFDNTIFSHAGLVSLFVEHFYPKATDLDTLLFQINSTAGEKEMWSDVSPIWVRPQDDNLPLYAEDMLQVVGHTPVKQAYLKDNLLSLDNFSTYRNYQRIGDGHFVIVDTVKKTWEFVMYDLDGYKGICSGIPYEWHDKIDHAVIEIQYKGTILTREVGHMTGPQFDMGIIGDASEMMIELAIEQYEQEKKARKILEVMKEYQ